MSTQPSSKLFIKNRQKLRESLNYSSLVILFSNQNMPRNGDQFFPYRENSDFYYFTGIEQENSALIITREEEYLFNHQQTKKEKLWDGEKLTPEAARRLSGIENIETIDKLEQTFTSLIAQKGHVFFNIQQPIHDKAVLTNDEFFFKRFKEKFPFLNYHTIKGIINKLRIKKEYEEIELIKQAIEITNKAFHRILNKTRHDISENELEAELRYEFQIHQSFPAYDPIIASGKNACTLHYIENNSECKSNDLLLLDIGAELHNYASDISRTIPVSGSYNKRQKECYQAVLDVQKKIIDAIEPGMNLSELNQKALEWLKEKHIELGLYKEEDLENENLTKKYFPHGVGHFMGLNVHDCGNKHTTLEPGMVITIEPGIYIPEENLGIRIEDNILIDEEIINLSQQIPKEIKTIEQKMKTGK